MACISRHSRLDQLLHRGPTMLVDAAIIKILCLSAAVIGARPMQREPLLFVWRGGQCSCMTPGMHVMAWLAWSRSPCTTGSLTKFPHGDCAHSESQVWLQQAEASDVPRLRIGACWRDRISLLIPKTIVMDLVHPCDCDSMHLLQETLVLQVQY